MFQAHFQYQLLSVVSNLQQVCEHDCKSVGQDMFNVLIYVMGLAGDTVITEQAEGLYTVVFVLYILETFFGVVSCAYTMMFYHVIINIFSSY